MLMGYCMVLFSHQMLLAQQIDSLERLAITLRDQAQLVTVFNQLSFEYLYVNPEKTLEYAQKTLEISQKKFPDEGNGPCLQQPGAL